MCGAVKGSVSSSAFDSDGITLVDRKIVEDGRAVALYGGTRYAQYLGETATGHLGCMSVECGTLNNNAKTSATYFRCASMSGLQVDIYNDYIGGEVRLGYLYNEAGEKTPITGISISGSLKAALNAISLSNKKTVKGAYEGPDFAILNGLTVI
jgi:predicted Zn-dependent protease